MTRLIALAAAVILAAGTSFAENPQPYAGLQTRPLKALSDEQLDDLKAGRGMRLALSAELNGYPGPKHVLELAMELKLTEPQRARTQRLYDAMKAEAIPLGQQLIAAEADLDRQFSGRTVTPARAVGCQASVSVRMATCSRSLPGNCRNFTNSTQPSRENGACRKPSGFSR